MARLAEVFQLIQQQQALEQRKEERHHDLALQLLVMDINKEEKALDREAGLIDRQLVRAEKKYDVIYGELETSKQEFSELTGQLYKAPDKDRTENAVGVVNDIGGPLLDSLNQLLTDTQNETQDLMTQKTDISGQMRQARLIQDFYTGVGHDYSAGDPDRWDVEDFSEQELSEYISQYPELEGVDQGAFYEGMKTKSAANLLGNMTALNAVIDQAKTANLNASIKQLNYDVKKGNMPAAQIEQDILTIDKGVHSMLQSQANVLNNNLLAPAIQASIEFATSQTLSNPEGDPDLEAVKEDQLILVGSQISGLPADSQNEDVRAENLRLGRAIVLGNSNYVNSIKGHLAGTGDLDYVGYANALQEIQFFGENARRQLEDGKITRDQYLAYKNQLERITGKNLNEFSSDMNLVMQAADQVENKGATLAIAGMKDQYEKYVPSIDYEVPEDYVSPITLEAAEAAREEAAMKHLSNIIMSDSTMIFPDSSNTLPDTSSILIDDPNIIPDSLNVVPDLNLILNKQQKVNDLTSKLDALKKSGFRGTEAYEDMENEIAVLNREIREEQLYTEYMENLPARLAEGQMSDEEIADISATTGVSESILREYLERGRTAKVLDILSKIPGTPSIESRAFYERRLQE